MIDKILLYLAGYALLVSGGWSVIREQGRKAELPLFVLIVACCVYMTLGQLLKWPQLSLIKLHELAFSDIGKWIMDRLRVNE
ncbi:MAG: hypothetical protein K0Q59_1319 [Paenibacillus sp.]|jgi:hypothetical protein|nr:hypothetical protein [Paenibacillus sp.]